MHRVNTSTPRFIQTPGKLSWMAATMLDFPDRGAPFRMTIRPGSVIFRFFRSRYRNGYAGGASPPRRPCPGCRPAPAAAPAA